MPRELPTATLGVRPEYLEVLGADSQSADSHGTRVSGRVLLVERLGGTSHIHFQVGPHRLLASVSSEELPEVEDSISVRIRSERLHLFGPDGRTAGAADNALATELGSL